MNKEIHLNNLYTSCITFNICIWSAWDIYW